MIFLDFLYKYLFLVLFSTNRGPSKNIGPGEKPPTPLPLLGPETTTVYELQYTLRAKERQYRV